jgi:hypothetical protein
MEGTLDSAATATDGGADGGVTPAPENVREGLF